MLKELKNIAMGKTWLSYAGSAWGVLKHAGLWDGDVFDLMGRSGLAFQFIVHKTACPSSVTVYDWAATHFAALDRIGVYTDALSAVLQPGLNTGGDLQADARNRIRESLDGGRGVVVWSPTPILEFGIITGYDDEERIFSVLDCVNERPDPLLYDNLGRGEVPMLYFQRFYSKHPVDGEKMLRDALQYGLGLWRAPGMHLDQGYGQGPAAYDNFIHTLKAGDYNPFGVSYCLNVYADCKRALAIFFGKAAAGGLLPGLDAQAGRYDRIAGLFRAMADAVPFRGPKDTAVDAEKVPELVKHLRECKKLESESMAELGGVLG